MAGLTSHFFRTGLSALWFSGAAHALSGWTAGKGALLMLHRVQPDRREPFAPNAALSITPEYLAALLASFRAAALDIVSLDEALRRLAAPGPTRRFVCFTFDDGYRDNLEHALPVFERYGAPFTVYATTSFLERSFAPWWCALEYVIARDRKVRWVQDGSESVHDTADLAGKHAAFAALSHAFFQLPVAEVKRHLQRLTEEHGLSVRELAERDICSWDELKTLRARGATIGCHTVSHALLLRETPQTVRQELVEAQQKLESELGCAVRHLAYPYGKRDHVGAREFALARELGFASAVTTRKGALFAEHAGHVHALPRVEVTPSFAGSPRYMQAILSGLPLLLWNRGRFAVTD